MAHRPLRPLVGPQFKAGKRAEGRAKRGVRDVLVHDAPTAGEFGAAEYVDQYGRQYRLATTAARPVVPPNTALGARARGTPLVRHAQGHVKLWIRYKRGGARQPDLVAGTGVNATLRLQPAADGVAVAPPAVAVRAVWQPRPGLRTASVFVSGWDAFAE